MHSRTRSSTRYPAARTAIVVLATLLAPPALAQGQPADRTDPGEQRIPEADLSVSRHADAEPRFGERGFEMVSITAAFAESFEDEPSTDIGGMVNYHRFIARDIEFIIEIAVLHFNQLGDNAIGVNPGFNLRYHFLELDKWSAFVDTGIGVLVSTDDVPDGGTSINFTPRVGAGLTRQITGGGARFIGGLRWHHISNARIEGDDRNPDRDGILVYAGISFPI